MIMNGARDEACKQADGHYVPTFISCTSCKEHTHTTKYTKKTEHPQILNCQQESDFHQMESNSTF